MHLDVSETLIQVPEVSSMISFKGRMEYFKSYIHFLYNAIQFNNAFFQIVPIRKMSQQNIIIMKKRLKWKVLFLMLLHL